MFPGAESPSYRIPGVSALLLVLSSMSVAAQDPGPLVTDRPDRSESAAVVLPGLVQLETGAALSSTGDAGTDVHDVSVAETLARIGVMDRVELRVGFGGWRIREIDGEARGPGEAGPIERSGAADASVGAKVRLAEGRGLRPDLAVMGTLSLPTGEAPFTSDGVDPSARIAAGHALPAGFSLGYNLGAQWPTTAGEGGGEERAAEGLYSVVLSRGLSPRVAVFAEAFGFVPLDGETEGRASVDGGLTVLLRDHLQLDLSGGLGVDPDAEDWFLGAGASVRVPR